MFWYLLFIHPPAACKAQGGEGQHWACCCIVNVFACVGMLTGILPSSCVLSMDLRCLLWLNSCQVPSGWAAYVKTQAGKLLKRMGIPSDAIIYPKIQKLVLYQHTWGQLSETVESADTAAMMVIVLPSQFQVSFLSRLSSVDASRVVLLPRIGSV